MHLDVTLVSVPFSLPVTVCILYVVRLKKNLTSLYFSTIFYTIKVSAFLFCFCYKVTTKNVYKNFMKRTNFMKRDN